MHPFDCNGTAASATFVMADGTMDIVSLLIFSTGKQNGGCSPCRLGLTVMDFNVAINAISCYTVCK